MPTPPSRDRTATYHEALRKIHYAQRLRPDERRELRRRRLADGSYPLPEAIVRKHLG